MTATSSELSGDEGRLNSGVRVAVVSGRAPASFADSATNHRAYAERFNYCFVETSWFTSESNRYRNKIHYILHVLPHFDYVFWLDDDAFFTNFDTSIEQLLPIGTQFVCLAWSSEHDVVPKHLATGSMIIRNCPKAFEWLNGALHLDINDVKSVWLDNWGFFSGGDQDLLVYLLKTSYPKSFALSNFLNIQGRLEDILAGGERPLVTHLTGTFPRKLVKYLQLIRVFDGSRHMFAVDSGLDVDDRVRNLYRIWTMLARGIVVIHRRASQPSARL